MIIPIGHENMETRRWPVITIALIALNLIIFILTYKTLDNEMQQMAEIKLKILAIAIMFPDVDMQPESRQIVDDFKKRNPDAWEAIDDADTDAWEAPQYPGNILNALLNNNKIAKDRQQYYAMLQKQMDSLNEQFVKISSNAISEQYAFVPAHPNPVSYLTANFLHGGWLHLIGNMWFLWLAGFVLEDTWGRWLYLAFYLVAGVAAIQFHLWTNIGSTVPTLGASGAVSALMGAFLIRFPKMKIQMVFIFWFIWLIFKKFKVVAYWLLPLWLAIEVFSGKLSENNTGGVAHWAHVGGFLFGMAAAMAIIFSGLERSVNKVIEEKLGLAKSEIEQADELMEQGKLDDALTILTSYVAVNPDSLDGWEMMRRIYATQRDAPAYQKATAKTCLLRLKGCDVEAAFQDYAEFINSGGEKMPVNVLLALCKGAESLQKFELALAEYQQLTQKYPGTRQALTARLNAARICLKELDRPQDALEHYQAAEAFTIFDMDLKTTIQSGIEEAKAAISASK